MDSMIPFLGPLVVSGVSVVISVVGLMVTTRAVRRLRAEKLQFDRALAAGISTLNRTLAEKHAAIDRTVSEMKFKHDRDLGEVNRMVELAEQALAQFHQIKDITDAVRSPNSFAGEAGNSRPEPPQVIEDDHEQFGRIDRVTEEIQQLGRPAMRGTK
jgi:hypothetical protein